MVDQPSEEDRLGFVRSYGVEPVTDINTDLTFKDAALSVAEMTPIIGDAMAAKEVYDELMKEDPNYKLIAALGGAALIGAIPGIGDAAAAGIRKAADVAKRIEVDPDAVGMMGGNIRLKPKEQLDFDAEMAALDKAEDATTWQQDAKKVVKKRGIDLDDKKSPEALELQESTRLLLENKITRDEHLANVDRLKPVGEYDQLPREPSDKALVFALDSGKREKGVFVLNDEVASKLGANTSSLKVGDQFNSRLDIPAYLAHDTWIVAGTSPAVKTADGKGVTTYAKAVHFGGDDKPVRFIASQKQSEKIGTGVDNKTGYATVSGTVKDLDADAIRAKAAELLDDPEWVQVGFDPRRQGGFYVRAGENKHIPVREATEVIQIGPLVLAKNAQLDFDYKGYSEGGMAVEEQMAMNFGDVPDNTIGIDPVSGNEIPLGSTAENVRDDIPAQLSEGELVIPADVVNYHGVKLFEDLRAEAKMGYAQMNEDGRMGGEPLPIMEEDDGLDIVIADLEVVDDMSEEETEEAFLGKFFAGIREQNKKQDEYNKSVQKTFDNAKDRQSVKNIKASAGKPKKKKFKNNFEKIMYNLFGDDDEPAQPPSKRKDKPKIDFGFGGNPMERASRKYGTEPTETKNESYRDTPKSVSRGYTPSNPSQTFAEYLNFGGKYDEGGMAVALPGKTGQMLPDDYDPLVDSVGGQMTTGEVEMREYRNSAGHTILIPFMDGVPMAVIPEGYYPVGSEPVVTPTGGSSGGGSGGGGEMQPTEPFNYKELTITELVDEVKNLQTTPQFAGTNLLTGVLMFAQKSHKNKTIKEIERRLDDPELDLYNREYLENLLEVAKAPAKKGALGKTIDKILGKEEQEDPPTVEDAKPEYDFSGPDAEGYEPTTSAKPEPTQPSSELSDKVKTEIRQASADAAAKAFGTPSKTVEPTGQEDFIAAVKQDPASFLPPTPPSESDDDDDTPSTGGYDPVGTGSVDDPSRKPTRSGGGGRNKGGMMQKKKKAKKKK